jgi:G3E family GTPase
MTEREGFQAQGREQQVRADTRIPVTLVTGFLGSGKSTLINRLLADHYGSRIAVIVNEFGEISFDHLLIARSDDAVIELANGCLCCTVRSDLVTTLFGLYAGKVDGSIAPFDHVVIETTGIADPGPILQMLYLEEAVARRYRLASVVTTVDAVHGLATLEREDEAIAQVSAADIILLTKCDLADGDTRQRLFAEIAILNPDCVKRSVSHGQVSPGLLLEDVRREPMHVLPVHSSMI